MSILVHASLIQRLGMIELVRVDIWEELCKLIVAIGSIAVILNLEVAEAQK